MIKEDFEDMCQFKNEIKIQNGESHHKKRV
jgi:hypothetical protein